MSINVTPVQSKSDYREFVKLPFEIYHGNKNWVPPILKDELKSLNPRENPAMEYCESCFWLAKKAGKTVGRIGAIINTKYNSKVGESLGRFSRLEYFEDENVFKALMDTAKGWLKEKGMIKLHGPLGFSNLDAQGLLIEGYGHLASVGSVYHLEYYKKHIENYGFKKENDWLEFRLTLGDRALEKGIRGSEIVKKRYGFESVSFRKNKDILPYVKDIFDILNKAYSKLPYVNSFDEKTVKIYTDKYFKLINPKFVKIVKKEDKLVGFLVAVPNLSEAMIKANGKLFPFGFLHLVRAMKRPSVLDLLLAGVLPELDHAGIPVLMFADIHEIMRKEGIKYIETTGVFETNHNVINNYNNYNSIQHKRRRCFVMEI
jgi:hypothetical protein